MNTKRSQYIIGRRNLVRIFGVTQGFVEDLERRGIIAPANFMLGKQTYKAFTAKDVNTIRDEAIASTYKTVRIRGKAMAKVLSARG